MPSIFAIGVCFVVFLVILVVIVSRQDADVVVNQADENTKVVPKYEDDKLREQIQKRLLNKVVETTKDIITETSKSYPNSVLLRKDLDDLIQVAVTAVHRTADRLRVEELTDSNCDELATIISTDIRTSAHLTRDEYETSIRDEQDVAFAAIHNKATAVYSTIANERKMASKGQIAAYINNMVDVEVSDIMLRAVKSVPDMMVTEPSKVIERASRDIEQFVWTVYKQNETAIVSSPDTVASDVTGSTFVVAHPNGSVVRVAM